MQGQVGRVWGHRLTLQQPTLIALQQLDALVREFKGTLSRLDVALYTSARDPKQLKADILRHLILRWRRGQSMRDVFATVYWCKLRTGKRPPPRNLTLYADRHNKATEKPIA